MIQFVFVNICLFNPFPFLEVPLAVIEAEKHNSSIPEYSINKAKKWDFKPGSPFSSNQNRRRMFGSAKSNWYH